jgi:hypothetical protein
MKKIYFQFFVLFASFGFVLFVQSCKKSGSFLAETSTTNLTQATVFADSSRTEGFLANIYASVGFSTSPTRFQANLTVCGGLDAASDESEPSHTYATDASGFATGTINAGTVSNDPYNTCYTQIRAVNQLLANIHLTKMLASNKNQLVAEARFLRAWYYFILLEHYGGVPLVGDSLYTYATPISVKRSTYAACVTYITSECDAAATVLPLTQSGINWGRASGGACMALKARVLLYAASPLFNGTTLPGDAGSSSSGAVDPSLVGYPTADPSRWQLAENAAQAVIASGAYTLNTVNTYQTTTPGYGFQGLFPQRVNTEYIFQLMRPSNNDLENLFLPPSRSGANGAFPYQGIVDAFPMSNGKLISDPTSGYDPTNPYNNRDPRLNYSIIHDQTLLNVRTGNGMINGQAPVNIYLGNNNNQNPDAVHQGTVTGYYCNKMLDPSAIAASFAFPSNRCMPLIRYAEILLDYAEAANEYEGPTSNVYNAIQAVRQRAGLNPYQLPSGLSQADMRTYIQNERRIELAFEGHRFFDVRRWKIAPQTENIQALGMEVDDNGSAVAYNEFNVTKHNFRPAMYLWPFPISETGKSATLIQNPGY